MPHNWLHQVDLAEAVLNKQPVDHIPDPLRVFSAISRAYYAAYRHAVECEVAHGSFTAYCDGYDHGRIIEQLRHHRRKPMTANKLGMLHEWRKDADYGEVGHRAEPDAEKATRAIKTAREIITELPYPPQIR